MAHNVGSISNWPRQGDRDRSADALRLSSASNFSAGNGFGSSHASMPVGAELGTDLSARLHELAEDLGASIPALIVACWGCVSSCYFPEQEVLLALGYVSPVAGDRVLTAVRVPSEGKGSVAEWLKEVSHRLELTAHAVPAGADRLANAKSLVLCGTPAEPPEWGAIINEKLVVQVTVGDSIRLEIRYGGAQISTELANVLLRCLTHLLQQLPARRNKPLCSLELVPSSMGARYLHRWVPVGASGVFSSVHQLIEKQSLIAPDRVAAVDRRTQISYGELNARANQLARYLLRMGSGPEVLVAVHLNRSVDLLIALLAVLKSGAAFLPLDWSLPEGRIRSVLEDSGAPLIIASSHRIGNLPPVAGRVLCIDTEEGAWGREDRSKLGLEYAPEHLAYVTYTSGSTGKPKGVMIEHRHLAASLAGMDGILGTEPGVWLAMANISFDISITELLWTLANGFKVILHEGDEGAPILSGPGSVAEQMIAHQVTHLQGTPSLMRILSHEASAAAAFATIRKLLVGGEHFPSALATLLRDLVPGDVLNMYGPTEVTICSASHRVEYAEEVIPIGRPTRGTSAYVLDEHLRLLPPLAPGELYLGGSSVGRGYFGRPELTAERFIPSPFQPESGRLYRTGDLVRMRLNGELEFIDRVDSQVKLRGYRVELGEIEAAMQAYGGVEQAAAVVHTTAAGEKALAAFYVTGEKRVSAGELRAHLQNTLPRYMVPASLQQLEVLPLTSTGKTDRIALAKLDLALRNTEASGPAAQAELPLSAGALEIEAAICAWCSEILQVKEVRPLDDFFELGGQSLAAVQLAQKISKRYRVHLLLSVLVHNRTMRAIANWVAEARQGVQAAWSPVVQLRDHGSKPPLFLIAGIGGSILNFDTLCSYFSGDRPIYAVETQGLDADQNVLSTIEEMAGSYLREIRRVQPEGPLHLAGYSFGGLIAFEMAQQLRADGEEVGFLGLIDTPELHYAEEVKAALPLAERVKILYGGTVRRLLFGPDRWKAFTARMEALRQACAGLCRQVLGRRARTEVGLAEQRNLTALSRYEPKFYKHPLHLFRCPDTSLLRGTDQLLGWGRVAEHIIVTEVPGEHGSLTVEPYVGFLGTALEMRVNQAESQHPEQRASAWRPLPLPEHVPTSA